MNAESDWTVYRTRFVVRARQLTDSLNFTDAFGREQCGQAGDYLVEIFDGFLTIAPRKFFEDVYVPLDAARVALRDAVRTRGAPLTPDPSLIARPASVGQPGAAA